MNLEAQEARRENRDQFIKSAGILAVTYTLEHTKDTFSAKIVTPADLDTKIQVPGVVKLDPAPRDYSSPFIAYAWAHALNQGITNEFMLALKVLAEEQGGNTDIVFLGESSLNRELVTHLATFEF